MPRGFLVGRLFGTNIYCAPSFFLLVAFYFLLQGPYAGAIFAIALLVSLLVHEFGHVFAVKWLLGAESTVILWGLGGLCVHPRTRSPGRQVGISLMGPAFGLGLGLLAVAAFALLPDGAPPTLDAFLRVMVWINLVWTFANLLPIVPLDGGQALRAALSAPLGAGRASRITRLVSMTGAGALAVAAWIAGFPLAAVLAALLFLENLNRRVAYD